MLRTPHPTRQEREDRREERNVARNNSDIRPWISIGEAASIALSGIEKKKREAKDGG